MQSRKRLQRAVMMTVFVILGLISLAYSLVLRLRRISLRAVGRYVASWWRLRAAVAKDMEALEARFNNYFSELMVVLLPHEREKLQDQFLETKELIRQARVKRRLGRFGTAALLIASADSTISAACSTLDSASRQVVWSEVLYQ